MTGATEIPGWPDAVVERVARYRHGAQLISPQPILVTFDYLSESARQDALDAARNVLGPYPARTPPDAAAPRKEPDLCAFCLALLVLILLLMAGVLGSLLWAAPP